MPRYFKDHGYLTLSGGKVLHHDFGGRLAGVIDRSLGRRHSPRPKKPMNRPGDWSAAWDWGAYPEEDAEMTDIQLAKNAAKVLGEDFDKPFFMSVGFFRPHVPLFVPPKWFELYDVEKITLPDNPVSDLDDVPKNFLGINDYALVPTHAEVVGNGKQRSLTQAYLASITLVDHCVGIVLDALKDSPHAPVRSRQTRTLADGQHDDVVLERGVERLAVRAEAHVVAARAFVEGWNDDGLEGRAFRGERRNEPNACGCADQEIARGKDDHAFQAIGAYGGCFGDLDLTPNIDRIADGGMRFDRCYVGNSICARSRATLLTGKHSHQGG